MSLELDVSFQNLCFTYRHIQAELSKLDMFML